MVLGMLRIMPGTFTAPAATVFPRNGDRAVIGDESELNPERVGASPKFPSPCPWFRQIINGRTAEDI